MKELCWEYNCNSCILILCRLCHYIQGKTSFYYVSFQNNYLHQSVSEQLYWSQTSQGYVKLSVLGTSNKHHAMLLGSSPGIIWRRKAWTVPLNGTTAYWCGFGRHGSVCACLIPPGSLLKTAGWFTVFGWGFSEVYQPWEGSDKVLLSTAFSYLW